MPSYLWLMTSPCLVLAGYRLVRSGPCACLFSIYVQNLSAAHASAVIDLHSLLSVFDYFLISLSFMACPIRGWALLVGGLCFSLAHPFSCYHLLPYHSIIPTAKLFASIMLGLFRPVVYSSPNGPIWPLVLLLHLSGLLCPICFPLGVLGSFAFLGLPQPFS